MTAAGANTRPIAQDPGTHDDATGSRYAANDFDLAGFQGVGYDKGRPVAVQALWFAVSRVIVMAWWCPAKIRVLILRAFGAEIGRNVLSDTACECTGRGNCRSATTPGLVRARGSSISSL